MIHVLQVNVGVCRAAQDLALATSTNKNIDILVISEQHRDKGEENGWYADAGGRSAIAVLGKLHVDAIGPRLQGIRWIELNGFRLYSCYCSPNIQFTEFEDFLGRLEASIREARCPVIIAGDFNAKSHEWGSPKEDKRGQAMADLAASLGLVVCNQGKEPTFVRGASESHIDLTFVSRNAMSQVLGWRVVEEETLSLHRYIEYEIGAPNKIAQAQKQNRWSFRKLDRTKLEEALKRNINAAPIDVDEASNQIIGWLSKACDASMPRSGKCSRRPVPWWNPDLAEQRKKCLKARRVYTRKRKKSDDNGCMVERESFQRERKSLSTMIQTAKEENWKRICELVDNDPWGLPYKIVMRKLNIRKPIPGINLPGRMDMIVSNLFPTRAIAASSIVEVSQEDVERALFTPGEVASMAKSLPSGKTPGPDGIPNEVLKVAVGLYPQRFSELFNECIRNAVYPSAWKVANLVLLRKPGKALDNPSAYRPLCMLDTTGKLFEKLLTARLREHLTLTGNTTDNQYGFKKGRSTVDAMSRVREIFQEANGRGPRNLFVGMLTLDVKNAFNSAPWGGILSALKRKGAPGYLLNILGQYLSGRKIVLDEESGPRTVGVSCGVPQGSVLGPDLWNVLYDDLLRMNLPADVEIIAFADDVALVATASVPFLLEERLEIALQDVINWMNANGLELAIDKTEAIMLTNRNKHNKMTIRCGQYSFQSVRCVKYLGVQLDSRLHFYQHGEYAAARSAEACRQLIQILPNLRGPRQRTRKLLATVVTSRLLYGAPFWFPSITAEATKKMETVYRRVMLRVACCYRTVSHDAAAVVSGMPPLKLLAEERLKTYRGTDKVAAREQLMESWQHQWEGSEKGRWTFRLIRDVGKWHRRNHGDVSFHLSQVLTGHGCFNEYLLRFGKVNNDECAQCGSAPDSVEHAIFQCDAWHQWRVEACVYLEIDELSPDNMIDRMLDSKAAWLRISNMIGRIMKIREEEERRRQHAAREPG